MKQKSRSSSGFSLIEVVITVGIITLGVLPLLALMTLSVNEQADANQESIATIIASGVFADVRRSGTEIGGLLYRHGSGYEMGDPLGDPNSDFSVVPTASGTGAVHVLYGLSETALLQDWTHLPIRELTPTGYSTGASDPNATHLVQISFELQSSGVAHVDANGSAALPYAFRPKLFKVVVSVEYPPQAAQADREKVEFLTYSNLDDFR